MIKHIKGDNFQTEVLNCELPVAVEFGAPWCVPCKHFLPILEQAAQQFKNRMKFVQISVDEDPIIAAQYDVGSLPTVLIFRDGKVIDRIIGSHQKSFIVEVFEQAIGGTKV